jgi:hypothetical protein
MKKRGRTQGRPLSLLSLPTPEGAPQGMPACDSATAQGAEVWFSVLGLGGALGWRPGDAILLGNGFLFLL